MWKVVVEDILKRNIADYAVNAFHHAQDKALASSILISFKENGIDDIIFYNQPEGVLYPEMNLEDNEKKLFGFIDRFKERILSKDKL